MASLRVDDGVAVITLLGEEGAHPWGTPIAEHRLNPVLVTALLAALDEAEGDSDVRSVVVCAEGRFWSNGFDLAWADSREPDEVAAFTRELNALMLRILTFPLPTVAALNGHWCAAGGMLGLAFDYRVMNAQRGYFFVPAVDLGVVYSAFQIELMKAKLPAAMHRDVMIYNAKRWRATDLVAQQVVHAAEPSAEEVLTRALALARSWKAKGQEPARQAMGPIKRLVYKQVVMALQEDQGQNGGAYMSFTGRSRSHNYAPPPPEAPLPEVAPAPPASKL